jgi:hypothetical protein
VSRSLLGLLLVVVLLGGLAALAVMSLSGTGSAPPAVTGTTGGTGASPAGSGGGPVRASLVQSCTADAKDVETALQAYDAQNGAYPTNMGALVPSYLREAPSNAHYTIVFDSGGRVGVLPPDSTLHGPVPDAADYDLHPELCQSVPR